MSLLKTVLPDAAPALRASDVARIVARLFETTNERQIPPRRVYAVLDGARDPSIVRRLAEAPGVAECLYRGITDPALRAAAPWLVELGPSDEWTRDLLLDGWGRSWGIFVEAALPAPALYRQLRTFLKVKDPAGRTLIFRYYDPRVWRVFAPICTTEQAHTMQGPIYKFYCESQDGRALIEHTASATGFAQRVLALDVDAPLAASS